MPLARRGSIDEYAAAGRAAADGGTAPISREPVPGDGLPSPWEAEAGSWFG